jgi:hypothetical protein
MKNRSLEAKIEGNELVIRIGIDTLAFCAEHCPLFFDYDNKKHREKGPPYVTITNKNELAHDTIRELLREEEDGSTPLSDLFDNVILAAFEDGSLGFEHDD